MMTATLLDIRSSASQADRAKAWLQWRPELPVQEAQRLTVAELAECICPDLCNRDHQND